MVGPVSLPTLIFSRLLRLSRIPIAGQARTEFGRATVQAYCWKGPTAAGGALVCHFGLFVRPRARKEEGKHLHKARVWASIVLHPHLLNLRDDRSPAPMRGFVMDHDLFPVSIFLASLGLHTFRTTPYVGTQYFLPSSIPSMSSNL